MFNLSADTTSQINASISLAIGWPINLLLVWLIVYRTNQQLRVWSFVLLQSSVMDMVMLFIASLNQPVICNINGEQPLLESEWAIRALFYNSARIPILFVHVLAALHKACHHSPIWISMAFHLPVMLEPFTNLTSLFSDKQISSKIYAFLFVIPGTFAFTKVVFAFWIILNSQCHSADEEFVFIANYHIKSILGTINYIIWLLSDAITLLLIVFFNLMCWLKIRSGLLPNHEQSQKISSQVCVVLLLQALYPVIFSTLPTVLIVVNVDMHKEIPAWLSLLGTQNWHTIAYPLFVLLIIGHYRRCLAQFFGCSKIGNTVEIGTEGQFIRRSNIK